MIKEKREDLERFIREQTAGPGGLGYRYIDLLNEELFKNDLKRMPAFEHHNELLNTVPGALYSTGILFPVDRTGTAKVGENDANDPDNNEEGQENGEEEEDTQALSQMHPNNMAITCCLNEAVKNQNDIVVMINARHYTRIPHKELNSNYGLLLEQPYQEFRDFVALFDGDPVIQKIRVVEKGKNIFLVADGLKPEDVSPIRSKIIKIDKIMAESLGSDREGQNISGYKEHLFKRLKKQVATDPERATVINILEKIESFENSVAHIKDLMEIFDSFSYGLWKCHKIEKEIKLTDLFVKPFTGKLIWTQKDQPDILKDIWKHKYQDESYASLSLNIQLGQDTRINKGKYFLKIQLVNTSTEFTKKEDDPRYYSVFNEIVNQRMFFGVQITVSSTHLTPYRDSSIDLTKTKFKEEEVNKYLFRQYEDYGIGHGCSVLWGKDGLENKYVRSEYLPSFDVPDIDPIPRNKNNKIEVGSGEYICAPFFKDARFLEFKWLSTFSEAKDEEIIAGLKELISTYGNWIDSGKKEFTNNMDTYVFSQCEKDKARMERNVDTLLAGKENKANLDCFRLMNSAMFMQMWHSRMVGSKKIHEFFGKDFTSFDHGFYEKATDKLIGDAPAAWRPFQIAFILLNLDGIFQKDTNVEWTSRNELVDLVWFPTGGGKTEAYLGLIALTIIHRRKQFRDEGGGTGVLMRYTLRLLTTQQFQRATMLIMALELIRRWDDKYGLGKEPIYIGLWVGKGSLPNSLADLREEYEELYKQQTSGKKDATSKIPFRSCPWCGQAFEPVSFELINDSTKTYYHNRILLKCSRENYACSFSLPKKSDNRRRDHGPIPVSLCDEEIYQHPPALLFGTVDKFAQLAHKISNETGKRNTDSRRLFGNPTCNWEGGKPKDGYLPPDLIIQDELHLLQGPLGSAVALFESAIDQLCTRKLGDKVIRPKIISSTATTRNTPLQIMALFDRDVNLFPKPGPSCDDSFFAFYKRSAKKDEPMVYGSKRRYVGILPTGRTQIWMQMRLIAIMMTHRAIFELKKIGNGNTTDAASYSKDLIAAMDFYYPVVSYFNSLREVGKTESQIHTYIIKEIRRVFSRAVRPGKLMQGLYTYEIEGGELTGRLSGEEVVAELARISTSWDPLKRFAHIQDGDVNPGKNLPDLVVATNMISVGIDVSRLNNIIMNSMPRNIAEYIQASSRVARDKEGLVLTLHHPFRARDVSHYEKFVEFHEKMYSYVEPISITPFTDKSIERYLGLYLATMLRHKTSFFERTSAQNISKLSQQQIEALTKEISQYFHKRHEHLINMPEIDTLLKDLLTKDSLAKIDKWIQSAIDEWKEKDQASTKRTRTLVFNNAVEKSQQDQLYIDIDEYEDNIESKKWQIPQSLRVVEPEAVINIKPQ